MWIEKKEKLLIAFGRYSRKGLNDLLIMKSSSEFFYDKFSFFYPLVEFVLKPHKSLLYEKINNLPPGRLLEVGVGNGSDLQNYRGHQITGIDTSLRMLRIAQKKSNASLLHMNGEGLAFPDEQYDYAVLSHVIAVVDDPEQLLNEVQRVLKNGGKLIVLNHSTPNNLLKYLDRSLSFLARRFHFRSVFYLKSLKTLENFKLLEEHNCPPMSYFKLLIFQKK